MKDLAHWNQILLAQNAQERVAWALKNYRGHIVLSSSFGAQAAVMLHLVTTQEPSIPVVVVDTGYLFPETYQFIDTLTERLKLNLHVARPAISAAWQEARHGKLWDGGLEGLEKYNQLNKVEPLEAALHHLHARAWLTGIRAQQSLTREKLGVLALKNGRVKVHPILDWTDRDVFQYLKNHNLPYHPLWDQGYVSIGDTHSTRQLTEGLSEAETRFMGLKRECGLHENSSSEGQLPEYSI
ncbi:MAG: phosphoadenylyl-sulfate reductase [Candidatus Methylacidiphilales bacterium]|nr:phosphoadenylyl-sulfate reductase [Candidatus Methylacidiphilales bacterium]